MEESEREDVERTLEATGSGAEPPSARVEVLRGAEVGRFVVLAKLGEGGMGVVYAAYDPELDRKVAIKILHRGPEDEHEEDDLPGSRLQREAQAMARLSHPNVLTVYDVGQHHGRVFLAMEFVDGDDLAHAIVRIRHDWRGIVRLHVQAGRGLAAAHAAGLVHRDFKPQNVLVARDGRVRVTDFGLARPTGVAEPAPTAEDSLVRPVAAARGGLTLGGRFAGTPAYMAPEQFHGLTADARTDQFAFCVALWEALHGERPFAGDSLAAIAFAVTEGRIREPRNDGGVPAPIRRALRRGLAVAPEGRWPSLEPMLDALEHALGAQRRRRRLAAGVLAGAAVLGFGARSLATDEAAPCDDAATAIAGAWDSMRRDRVAEAFDRTDVPFARPTFEAAAAALDTYAADWADGYRDACEATHVRAEQSLELFDLRMACLSRARMALTALADRLENADREMLSRATFAASALPSLDTCSDLENLRMLMPASRDPEAEERLRGLITAGNITVALGGFDDAQASGERALELARHLAHDPLESEALTLLGMVAEERGEYETAYALYDDAAWIAYRVGHDLQVAWVAGHLVTLAASRLAKPELAQLWGQMGEAALARYGESPRAEARLWSDLGNLALQRGDYEHATDYYDRAVARYVQIAGANHPAIGNIANNAGNVLFNRGDFEAAGREYERALVNLRANYGQSHPDVAATLHNLANVRLQRGDADGAIDLYGEALAMREQLLGREHTATAATMSSLGVALLRKGKVAAARALFEGALTIFEKSGGRAHPTAGAARINLAETWERDGKLELARQYFVEARDIFRQTLGPEHPYLAFADAGLGRIALAEGRLDDAQGLLEQTLARDAAGDPELAATTRLALAHTLARSGREPERARELATQALPGLRALGLDARVHEAEAFLAHR